MTTPLETLLGGTRADVTLLDGSVETITVRQLPVRDLPRLLQASAQADESAMAELYCAKPAGWADTLTRESHERIIAEGERLNADFFARWLQRKTRREETLFPGQQEALLKLAAQLAISQTPTPSPEPSPSSLSGAT